MKGKYMFYIGDWNKQKIINFYVNNNDVRNVIVIYTKRLFENYNLNIEHEYIEIHDVHDYKNHYRLLQSVNRYTLIVLDNLLISQQRYSTEYNCIANLINQTPHRLVFNYFPFIENSNDFMILLDFYNRVKYKGERFDYELFKDFKYFIKPIEINLNFINVDVSDEDKETFNKERDRLFNEIGLKNPNIIPNTLSMLCGDIKHKNIEKVNNSFTSRNRRYKDLTTYKDDELNTILDFPTNRKDFVELLTKTRKKDINILTSELPMDKWYKEDYLKWLERLKEFYDKANVFKNKCG